MVLPLLALGAGAALSAGVKGVQNLIQGQEQEKKAKREAMRRLYSNLNLDPKVVSAGEPIPKAPGFGEAVVAPMAAAGAGSALSSGLSGLGAKKVDDAAKTALAATPYPTEAYTNAQAAQNQSLQDYFKKPPQPGY